MRPKLIIVYTPILHLLAGIRKGQEPVLIQTFGAEAAIGRFNERIVGRFAGA